MTSLRLQRDCKPCVRAASRAQPAKANHAQARCHRHSTAFAVGTFRNSTLLVPRFDIEIEMAALLAHRRILVVEDNYLIALELQEALRREGASVLGPVPYVADAVDLLERLPKPDAALLDVELGDETSFPVADMLVSRGVPFVFVSGAARALIPSHLVMVPLLPKPFALPDVVREVASLLAEAGSPPRH